MLVLAGKQHVAKLSTGGADEGRAARGAGAEGAGERRVQARERGVGGPFETCWVSGSEAPADELAASAICAPPPPPLAPNRVNAENAAREE